MRPVTPGDAGGLARLQHLPQFQRYALGPGYDEMFDGLGVTRDHYAALYDRLGVVDPQELRQRQSAADLAFLHQGITFTVYGQNEGTERIFPYDLIPRILTATEWDAIERGLTQRITALNLFLTDLYGDARVLADGVVPRELVCSCKHFRREMQGVKVRHDIFVSVAGTDLVRLPDGTFAVLEDNLRVPWRVCRELRESSCGAARRARCSGSTRKRRWPSCSWPTRRAPSADTIASSSSCWSSRPSRTDTDRRPFAHVRRTR